jgi:hypothetical protein
MIADRELRALPKADVARVIGNQLLRSGTAISANYRAATILSIVFASIRRARGKAKPAVRYND